MGVLSSISSAINSIKDRSQQIKNNAFMTGLKEDLVGPLYSVLLGKVEEIIMEDLSELSPVSKVAVFNEVAYNFINWRPKLGKDKDSTISYLRFLCGIEYCFTKDLRLNSARTLINIVSASKLDINTDIADLHIILNSLLDAQDAEEAKVDINQSNVKSFMESLDRINNMASGGNESIQNVKEVTKQLDTVLNSMYSAPAKKDSLDKATIIKNAKSKLISIINKLNAVNNYIDVSNSAKDFYDGTPLGFITNYVACMMANIMRSNLNSPPDKQAIIMLALQVMKKVMEYAIDSATILSEKKGGKADLTAIDSSMLRIKALAFTSSSNPDPNIIEGLRSELDTTYDNLKCEVNTCNLPYWYNLAITAIGRDALDRFYIAGLSGAWELFGSITSENSEFDSDSVNFISRLNIPAYRKLGAIKTLTANSESINDKFSRLMNETAESMTSFTDSMEMSAELVASDVENMLATDLKKVLETVYKELWESTGSYISKISVNMASIEKVAPTDNEAMQIASDHISTVIGILTKHSDSKLYGVIDEALADFNSLVDRYWRNSVNSDVKNRLLQMLKESNIFIATIKERYRLM